jgi:DNA-binding CsgD family transcriptional regulator/ribosomal protein L25 (general stress protein Ctc)
VKNQLLQMNEDFSGKFREKIKKIAEPLLRCFKCDYFIFYQVTNKGGMNYVSTDIEALSQYFGNDYHKFDRQLRLPEKFVSGVCYSKGNLNVLEKFPYNREFAYVIKTKERMMVFALDIKGKKSLLPLVGRAIRNEFLFESYANFFLNEMKPIIRRMDEQAVNLRKDLENPYFNEELLLFTQEECSTLLKDIGLLRSQYADALFPTPQERLTFLREIGLLDRGYIENLTLREFECLKLYVFGYTAAEIANKLHLAYRTIEHRIEKIKCKLGCFTRSELIRKGNILLKGRGFEEE